jgi:hypothetical protein
MIFVFAAAGALERSSSISKGGFPSTGFPIEKPRRSKSGCCSIPVWRSSAGIAEARLQKGQGRERHKLDKLLRGGMYCPTSVTLCRVSFSTPQPLLKSLTQAPSAEASSEVSQPEPVPWHSGMTNRNEEKSQRLHQQRVELYHQIQDLAAKKMDVANIARQIGVSRQTVYNSLQMKQPPERTRIHLGGKRLIDPYKDYLVGRWNEGCRSAKPDVS